MALAHEPMAMQPAIGHQNGRGIWIYNQLPCHRISDFFEGSNRGVQLIAGPGTQYSFPYLRERLGYVRNPRSLMEGTETLCCDDIGDLPGSPEHLWLRENTNEIG